MAQGPSSLFAYKLSNEIFSSATINPDASFVVESLILLQFHYLQKSFHFSGEKTYNFWYSKKME